MIDSAAPSSHAPSLPAAAEWDAIVVGAGPAGGMAALRLARAGLRVLLVERDRFPRWKVCGACLNAGARAALASVGLTERIEALGAVPLTRMSLRSGDRRARIALQGPVALSRPALDAAIADEAVARGATFLTETRASLAGSTRDGVLVRLERRGEHVLHMARVAFDASGLAGGGLRSDADAAPTTAAGSRIGIGATLSEGAVDLPRGELRMVVGRQGYVGLVRLEDGQLNLGAAVDASAVRDASPSGAVRSILEEAGEPALAEDATHGWRGTPALTRRRDPAACPRVLRLGDAAGYVEPFTGEGMGWAMDDAAEAARLVLAERGDPSVDPGPAWAARQSASRAHSQRLCRILSWGLRRPRLVRSSVGLLGLAPFLASPMVRQASRHPRAAVGLEPPVETLPYRSP